MPIYGVVHTTGADPFYWVRAILASNKGTLMELGISPIITAGMFSQFFAGVKLLKVDMSNPKERDLLKGAEKCKIS